MTTIPIGFARIAALNNQVAAAAALDATAPILSATARAFSAIVARTAAAVEIPSAAAFPRSRHHRGGELYARQRRLRAGQAVGGHRAGGHDAAAERHRRRHPDEQLDSPEPG